MKQLNLALLLQTLESQASASELTEETWLADDGLVTCVHADGSLCVGFQRTLLCIHERDCSDSSLIRTEPPLLLGAPPVTWSFASGASAQAISSVQAVPDTETITTAVWLQITSEDPSDSPPIFRGTQSPGLTADIPEKVIMIGTSSGHVQLHDPRGQLLHRQLLHEQPALGIQTSLTTPPTIRAMPSQQMFTIVVSFGSALCSITSEAVGAVLHNIGTHMNASKLAESQASLQHAAFCYTKWLMSSGTRARSDGACVPTMQHLWRDALGAYTRGGGETEEAAATYVSVGQGPAVAQLEARDASGAAVHDVPGMQVSDDQSTALDIAAKTFPGSLFKPVVSVAANMLGLHPAGCRCDVADTVNAIVDDRAVEVLVPSPSGQLAACTDDKGRVMLLDTTNLCWLRAWKGYRDAHCAWLQVAEPLCHRDGSDEPLWHCAQAVTAESGCSNCGQAADHCLDATNQAQYSFAPVQRTHSQSGGSPRNVQQPATTYLLIYAPRREVLEIWPPRAGPCLRTYKCGSNCALMSPLQTWAQPGTHPYGSAGKIVQDCFVLNGTTGKLYSMQARLRGEE